MLTVILADATVLDVQDVHLTEPALIMAAKDRAAFLDAWDKLTPEALDLVEIYRDGVKLVGFEHCEMQNIQLVLNYDGSMTAYFYLAGDTQEVIDPDYKRAFEVVTGNELN